MEVLRTSTQMGTRTCVNMEARVAALFAKRHGIMVNSGSSANLPRDRAARAAAGRRGRHARPDVRHHGGAAGRDGLVPVVRRRRAGHVQHRRRADRGDDRRRRPARSMVPSLIGNLPDWDRIAEIAPRTGCGRRGFRGHAGRDAARHEHGYALAHQHDELLRLARHQLRRQRRHALRQPTTTVADEARLLRSWGRSSSLFVDSENPENRFEVNARRHRI